jgi:hypothetical protein
MHSSRASASRPPSSFAACAAARQPPGSGTPSPGTGSGLDTAPGRLHTGLTLRQSPHSRSIFTAPFRTASVILIVVVISILPF